MDSISIINVVEMGIHLSKNWGVPICPAATSQIGNLQSKVSVEIVE